MTKSGGNMNLPDKVIENAILKTTDPVLSLGFFSQSDMTNSQMTNIGVAVKNQKNSINNFTVIYSKKNGSLKSNNVKQMKPTEK